MINNKMSDGFYKTLPWRIAARKHSESFYVIHGKDGNRELQILKMHYGPHPDQDHLDRQEDNAEAIVRAVNATYGNGINPEAVKDMYESLKMQEKLIKCLLGSKPYKNADETIAFAKAAIDKAKL